LTALIAALAAAAVLGGILLVVAGLRPVPETELVARPQSRRVLRLRAALNGALVEGPHVQRRRAQLVLAVGGGMLAFGITGLALMVLAIPVAVLGLPKLLGTPASAADADRLEALEEWTRNLAGVLAVGVSLEQAIQASLRSTWGRSGRRSRPSSPGSQPAGRPTPHSGHSPTTSTTRPVIWSRQA